jgi:hypothetical protein
LLEDRAAFICGHPKSGTSLLRAMLDSHPQLVVFPEETKFFRQVLPALAGLEGPQAAAAVEDRLLRVFQWNTAAPVPSQAGFADRDYSHLDFDQVLASYRRLLGSWQGDPVRLLPLAILAYGEASGRLKPETRRWVEKSPYNERHAERIFAVWPEALCLHLVRDPRDNYSSYRRKHPDWSPAVFAESWRQSTRLGWKNQRRFGPDRYRMLRYEDLIVRTDESIDGIIRFLGIDDADTLRVPTRDGRVWMGNSMFGDAFADIDRRPVGRYARELAPDLSRELELHLAAEMGRFTYALSRPLTSGEKLAAAALRAKRAWRAVRSSLRRTLPERAGASRREQVSDD